MFTILCLSLSLAQQQSLIHNLHERLFPTLLFYYFQSEAKLVQAGFLTASNLFKAIFWPSWNILPYGHTSSRSAVLGQFVFSVPRDFALFDLFTFLFYCLLGHHKMSFYCPTSHSGTRGNISWQKSYRWGSNPGNLQSVWPEKNRQMSIKVAQKWFH